MWAKSEGVPPTVGREGWRHGCGIRGSFGHRGRGRCHDGGIKRAAPTTTGEDVVTAAESGGQLLPPREGRVAAQIGHCGREGGGAAQVSHRGREERREIRKGGGGGIGRVGWWSGGCKEE
jgi:hypothetical protein